MSLFSIFLSGWIAIARVDQDPDEVEAAPPATAPPLTPAPSSAPAPAPPPGSPPPASVVVAPPPAPPAPPIDFGETVRAAYQRAEDQQGPLDGRWRLTDANGDPMFAFVIVDTNGAPYSRATTPDHPAIEGAWRDLRRAGGAGATGLLDRVRHQVDEVEIEFDQAKPATRIEISLHDVGRGVWAGELTVGVASQAVVMTRF